MKSTKHQSHLYHHSKLPRYCLDPIKHLVIPNLHHLPDRKLFSDERNYFNNIFSKNKACFYKLGRAAITKIFGEPHGVEEDNLVYKFASQKEGDYDFYTFEFNESGYCYDVGSGSFSWSH